MNTVSFSPPVLFRSPHVQTILSSSRIRLLRALPVKKAQQSLIIEAGGGIRLAGFLSTPTGRPRRGIVILLHGWEGSVDSTYCVRTADALFRNGYSVFRLNLRDHGGTHHLNEGLFYAFLLDEVHSAVSQAAQLAGEGPAFVVGFSLGGNFALRIALRCAREPIENLRFVFCVSPVLDPEKATDRIDSIPYIRHYFMMKWRRSLARKQACFPKTYDFDRFLATTSIRALTDALLENYSHFNSTTDYFRSYTLERADLQENPVATAILTAADDPIIPVDDFRRLTLNKGTQLSIQRFGGHNGFIEGVSMRSWYEDRIVSVFNERAP